MAQLRFRDTDALLKGMGVLTSAGVDFEPVGGNEVVTRGLALSDEQNDQLAELVRDPLPGPEPTDRPAAAAPPGAGDGTEATTEGVSVGAAPPKSGPGSGRDAWVVHAESLNVTVTDDMSRDDIIEAVEAHRGS